jgi:hypothetical protein
MGGLTYDELAYSELIDVCEEKDARIEELEAALREIRDQQGAYLPSPRDIARKALESDE